jgi:hypothetical protein
MYCQNFCKIEHTCQQPNLFVHVYDILPVYFVNVSIYLRASRGKTGLQLPSSIDLQATQPHASIDLTFTPSEFLKTFATRLDANTHKGPKVKSLSPTHIHLICPL